MSCAALAEIIFYRGWRLDDEVAAIVWCGFGMPEITTDEVMGLVLARADFPDIMHLWKKQPPKRLTGQLGVAVLQWLDQEQSVYCF